MVDFSFSSASHRGGSFKQTATPGGALIWNSNHLMSVTLNAAFVKGMCSSE